MKNVFIINAHQKYPFSEGKLNAAYTEKAIQFFSSNGLEVRSISMEESYDPAEQVANFKWADLIFLQTPINWMGVSWSFKKYIDEVFSLGMMGELSNGDGRTQNAPKKNYGLGGKLKANYMFSITANAPKEAFNNAEETFFNGISEDDLFLPMHLNFKWMGLEKLPTFMAYDVMKNPDIESDFERFDAHLKQNFLK